MPPHRPRPPRAPAVAPPTSAALVPQLPARLARLSREHAHLTKTLAAKRKELARTREEVETVGRAYASRIEPVLRAFAALDAEIHALFREILARDALPKRARTGVRGVYVELQERGAISPRRAGDRRRDADAAAADDDPVFYADDPEPPRAGAGGVSAPVAQGAGAATVRSVFLRLAAILHPDKVQDPDAKAAHTELMKEITRAYEDGDIARLVELERRHLGAEAPAAAPIPDDVDARCAALERMNAALAAQLKTVRRELRSLRAGPDGETLKDLKSSGRPLAEAVAAMIEEAEAELAALTRLRDVVGAFRDGRASLAELEAEARHR